MNTMRLSGPNLLLRLEGLAIFGASVLAFAQLGGSGWLFAALLFAPDLAMLGYLVNVRVGALTYNIAHTLIVPGVLLLAGLAAGSTFAAHIALIWLAHIGMDRIVGYGLKYGTAFKDTHMGRV